MAYSIQVTGMEELLNKMDKLPEIADKVAAEICAYKPVGAGNKYFHF